MHSRQVFHHKKIAIEEKAYDAGWKDRNAVENLVKAEEKGRNYGRIDIDILKKERSNNFSLMTFSDDSGIFSNLSGPTKRHNETNEFLASNNNRSRFVASSSSSEKGHSFSTAKNSLEEYLDQVSLPSQKQLKLIKQHVASHGGVLLVDPVRNEKVHLDEDHHSLTEKDLFIVRGSQCTQDDGASLVSTVTDVTYGLAKNHIPRFDLSAVDPVPKPAEFSGFACGGIFPLQQMFESVKMNSDPPVPQNIKYDGRQVVKSNLMDASKPVDPRQRQKPSLMNTETVIVCVSSTYIATQDEIMGDEDFLLKKVSKDGRMLQGLRCSWNEPLLSHRLGIVFKEESDSQAYVDEVVKDSPADQCGVIPGDVVSFAVPLSHCESYDHACQLVGRLEMIGMKTSYRELFDMFLSKTTSGWPIAIVFRRQLNCDIASSMPSLAIETRQAAACLHELVTRSREYDYLLESSGLNEIIRGNIELFFPRPQRNKDTKKSTWSTLKSRLSAITVSQYGPFLPFPINDVHQQLAIIEPLLWRRTIFKKIIDRATGIFFASFANSTTTGTGIALSRLLDGSWSNPSSVSFTTSDIKMIHFMGTTEYIVFSYDELIVKSLFRGQKIDLSSRSDDENSIVTFMKCDGQYYLTRNGGVTFTVSPSCEPVSPFRDQECSLPNYVQEPQSGSIYLYGALRRLEHPSSMYPHPTIPRNLSKYATNDWDLYNSCIPVNNLEYPVDCCGRMNLRKFLETLKREEDRWKEELSELQMFRVKFKLFIIDGMSVEYFCNQRGTNSTAKGVLALDIIPGGKLCTAKVMILGSHGERRHDIASYSSEIDLRMLSRISTKSPSMALDRKEKKRFVCLETHDKKQLVFLAKTVKDANLCLCGFKLLLEHMLQQNVETRCMLR